MVLIKYNFKVELRGTQIWGCVELRSTGGDKFFAQSKIKFYHVSPRFAKFHQASHIKKNNQRRLFKLSCGKFSVSFPTV